MTDKIRANKFAGHMAGNVLQREIDKNKTTFTASARMCSKCKTLRGILGGSNRHRIFICKECRNAPSV